MCLARLTEIALSCAEALDRSQMPTVSGMLKPPFRRQAACIVAFAFASCLPFGCPVSTKSMDLHGPCSSALAPLTLHRWRQCKRLPAATVGALSRAG